MFWKSEIMICKLSNNENWIELRKIRCFEKKVTVEIQTNEGGKWKNGFWAFKLKKWLRL